MALLTLAKVSPLYYQEMAAGSSLLPGKVAPVSAHVATKLLDS